MTSAYIVPQALSAPAVLGSSTRPTPSSRAIGHDVQARRAAARPQSSPRAGRCPARCVISRIAPTMFSVAITITAEAASSTVQPSGSATRLHGLPRGRRRPAPGGHPGSGRGRCSRAPPPQSVTVGSDAAAPVAGRARGPRRHSAGRRASSPPGRARRWSRRPPRCSSRRRRGCR